MKLNESFFKTLFIIFIVVGVVVIGVKYVNFIYGVN
jgi:hypothetical protein